MRELQPMQIRRGIFLGRETACVVSVLTVRYERRADGAKLLGRRNCNLGRRFFFARSLLRLSPAFSQAYEERLVVVASWWWISKPELVRSSLCGSLAAARAVVRTSLRCARAETENLHFTDGISAPRIAPLPVHGSLGVISSPAPIERYRARSPTMTSPPKVAQLSLDDSRTLTRDQGRLHSEGTGAGSDMATLSSVAHSQHAAISPIVLSYSSSFRAAQSAMNPANLPKAPTELPTLPVVGEADPTLHAGSPPSGVSSTAASSVVPTPDHSRPPTPPGSSFSPPPNGTAALLPTAVLSKSASPSAPLSTTSSVSGTTSTLTAKASVKSTAEKAEKKSVFGKLFERNNASSSSVVSSSGATAGSPPMDRADGSTNSNVGTAAPLTRKISKKEKDKEEKAQEKKDKDAARPRAESNGYLSAGAASDKGGMGAALNEFMRNKVARKSSATSKKSDDGKSDDGKKSNAGGEGSQYGGSTKDETKSKSGMTTTSTLKKYGVCEKVLIGKGATAVVKLAHKWDRTTERLYAVKVRFSSSFRRAIADFACAQEFRKRRKNETEKEYVKKLTSEFCISSTLHQCVRSSYI